MVCGVPNRFSLDSLIHGRFARRRFVKTCDVRPFISIDCVSPFNREAKLTTGLFTVNFIYKT